MIFKVFSVFDTKANAFMLPFYALNVSVAKRNLSRAMQDETTDFYHFPADYSLFEVGEWDGDTGKLSASVAPFDHGLLSLFAVQGASISEIRQAFEVKK